MGGANNTVLCCHGLQVVVVVVAVVEVVVVLVVVVVVVDSSRNLTREHGTTAQLRMSARLLRYRNGLVLTRSRGSQHGWMCNR